MPFICKPRYFIVGSYQSQCIDHDCEMLVSGIRPLCKLASLLRFSWLRSGQELGSYLLYCGARSGPPLSTFQPNQIPRPRLLQELKRIIYSLRQDCLSLPIFIILFIHQKYRVAKGRKASSNRRLRLCHSPSRNKKANTAYSQDNSNKGQSFVSSAGV